LANPWTPGAEIVAPAPTSLSIVKVCVSYRQMRAPETASSP
jgi:hypothetical protein